MNINLHLTADSPADLIAGLTALAAAFAIPATMVAGDSSTAAEVAAAQPRKPGRPRKADTAPPEAPTAPTVTDEITGVTLPDPAAVVAARIAAVSAEATPPPAAVEAPAPSQEAAPETLDKKTVQNALIAVVQKHGAKACGDICKKYGAPNLTPIDPKHWPAVYADAKAALAADVAAA